MCGLVVLIGLRGPARSARPGGRSLNFVLLAAAAPVLWLAYNAIVYRNPLEFANGPYSAKAIEQRTPVPGFPPHPGTHNLPAAGMYFLKSAEFSRRGRELAAASGYCCALAGSRVCAWSLIVDVCAAAAALDSRAVLHAFRRLRRRADLHARVVAVFAITTCVMDCSCCRRWRCLWRWPCYYLRVVDATHGRQAGDALLAVRCIRGRELCGRLARAAGLLSRSLDQFADAICSWRAELAEQLQGASRRFHLAHVSGRHVGRLAARRHPAAAGDQRRQPPHLEAARPIPRACGSGHWPIRAQYADYVVAFEGDPVWQAVQAQQLARGRGDSR